METLKERKRSATLGKYRELPDFPREIFLDLTSFCNHACVFCANPKISNKTTMESDMVYRVLHEAYDCGVRDLGLYATGESFLVKDLAKYVAYAKETVGYEYLFITTNGALATPERVQPVLDAGLDSIKFSLSAGSRESYQVIQGRDDFDLVIDNLRWVARYRRDNGKQYNIYVTMVYTDATAHEVDHLKELVLPYIDEWDPHPLNNQCGNMPENNILGEIKSDNPRTRGKRKVCFQPFKGFTITSEGFVSACVLDYSKDLIVGDLKKNSLLEIWEGSVYKEFRRRHLARDIKGLICYNCMNNADEPVLPLTPEYGQHFRDAINQTIKKNIEDDPNTLMQYVSERTTIG
jgi:MoaA/NifB/PqqE/SkfB family radical SAM enzyme